MVEQPVKLRANGREITFTLDLDPNDVQDNFMLQHFMQDTCYEPELAWLMFRTLHEGNVVIDVGANMGFFALIASRLVGPTGKVIACEPGQNNLPQLRRHLDKNAVTNTQIISYPIWCCEEQVTFYINADSRGGNALFDPANWWSNEKSRDKPEPVAMQSTTIDKLMIKETAAKVRLIKIDTEGAEQKILEGAQGLLSTVRPPFIVAEINPHGLLQSGCDETTLRKYMSQFGYEAFAMHANGAMPALIPHDTRINKPDDYHICNVLFSDMPSIAAAWPTAN